MRTLLLVALAATAIAIVACSGGQNTCDPSVCAETAVDSGHPATDAATPPAPSDAAAHDAAVADATCPPTVDEAGVTHGCGAGGMGSGDHDDGGGALAPPSDAAADASGLPFGASCLSGAQCVTGVCYDYKVRGTFCTQACTTNADCPIQSAGCNGMGFCRIAGT